METTHPAAIPFLSSSSQVLELSRRDLWSYVGPGTLILEEETLLFASSRKYKFHKDIGALGLLRQCFCNRLNSVGQWVQEQKLSRTTRYQRLQTDRVVR